MSSPRAHRKSTLEDVARLAGVSRATAARALTQPHLLRTDTLSAVNSAIDRLGYVGDAAARALASGRSGMIGAVVPTLDNAVFSKAIHRLQVGLAEGGLQLVVAAHEYDVAHEADAVRSLLSRGIDALILVGTERPQDTWRMLSASNVPVVLTYSFHPAFDSIGFDNERAGYLAASHLTALGHRRIGFVSGPRRNNDRMALRISGVARALAEVSAEFPDAYVSEQEFSLTGGQRGARELMSRAAPPTAIIGGNDMIAAGALHALIEKGVRVPEDVSVVGIENLEITTFTTPPLTSVQLPTAEIGTVAARHVLALLRQERVERRIELKVSLCARNSSARCPVSVSSAD